MDRQAELSPRLGQLLDRVFCSPPRLVPVLRLGGALAVRENEPIAAGPSVYPCRLRLVPHQAWPEQGPPPETGVLLDGSDRAPPSHQPRRGRALSLGVRTADPVP